MSRRKTVMITWGSLQQPDMAAIAAAVHEISGGKVWVQPYSTGAGQYAVTISGREMQASEQAELFAQE